MKIFFALDKLFDGSWKDGFESLALLVLRLGFGLGMITHGLDKFERWDSMSTQFPDPLGVGSPALSLGLVVFAELFCAALLVAGLFTRLASIPLIITMGVAFFVIHADDPFQRKELAMAYGVAYLAILFKGAGRLSLDALFLKK